MVLQIKKLSVSVAVSDKKIVDDLSLQIPDRSVFALVGGSGSGKSTTGLSILRLLAPGLEISGGEIVFAGRDLLKVHTDELRNIRGKEIAMVFQEPLYAFNPVLTIGDQIEEVFSSHTDFPKDKRRSQSLELLRVVGIKEPQRVYHNYPHQLSGGMRQRAMIAQAVALKPKLIIADEPTSSLDVTLQARILELFAKLRQEFDLSVLLITHDLGVVKHMADSVAVMKAGKIVESGMAATVLKNPQHQYTRELLAYAS
ncbi:MAG: ABC transporter ATP-binding protein [Candidatus Omnitrophica bacterium]|nr:ABC transporter ATP-binding protein [Candidatus Omnitrophota bacterium]